LGDDFRQFFAKFRVDQTVSCEETIVAGEWAFDRSRVSTKLVPVTGGEPSQIDSRVVVILRRDPDGSWKVARTIAVLG
jgi:ketosteroid isomerase-like protein